MATTEAEHGAPRVAACTELPDIGYGKASQPVEGQVQFGISAELERLLAEHDGKSRSIPTASDRPEANGTLLRCRPQWPTRDEPPRRKGGYDPFARRKKD
jgi:hypothetical protein